MNFQDRYSLTDRLLHRVAFSCIGAQKALSEVEDSLFARRLSGVRVEQPLFITSLPRAGTTILLEILESLDEFVSHSYLDMPFLLIPLLWDSISSGFRQDNSDAEFQRAHGDGMTIRYDSPEAFEEVLWKAYWPEKYLVDRITTWYADDRDTYNEFPAFLRKHIVKLLALRAGDRVLSSRYLSKNNGNVSRIPTLLELFPDATVLVPFRNPVDHVGSMYRQHIRFSRIHREEPFVSRYMSDIGHFDFGENLRPVNFDWWLDDHVVAQPDSPDFWLMYWCAGFNHLLSISDSRVVFLDYDAFCRSPESVARQVARKIAVLRPSRLVESVGRLREPNSYRDDDMGLDQSLLEQASDIHGRLKNWADKNF